MNDAEMLKLLGTLRDNPDEIVKAAARMRLLNFARYMMPELEVEHWQFVYYTALDMFAHGKIKNLIITAPPQHGKSQGSSRFLPSFMLGLNPNLRIALMSYATGLAQGFNRSVQRLIDSDKYRLLFPETFLSRSNVVTMSHSYQRNSNVLEMVNKKGCFIVVGRNGGLTGQPVDVAILDDLYKDKLEGNSPVVRAAAWSTYTSVVRSRLRNNGQQLIVFTRWHNEDVIGMLEESGEKIIEATCFADLENIPEDAWIKINFQAIKEGPPTEFDPRQPGEALWPSEHSAKKLLKEKALDEVVFECLYQGNPGNSEGMLYQPFKTYVDKSDYGTLIRKGNYTDIKDDGNDYLASVCYDIYKSDSTEFNEHTKKHEPILYAMITDMIFTHSGTEITTTTVPEMINRNGTEKAWIESNAGGSIFAKTVKPKISGITEWFHQSGNKESRIITAASDVNRYIIMPINWEERWPEAAKHLKTFKRQFSANSTDDIEDALTGIFEKEIAEKNIKPYSHQSRGIKRLN